MTIAGKGSFFPEDSPNLAKINGGTEVIVMTDGGDEVKVVPPGVLTHDDFSPRGGKNTPGGNEDIWQCK